MNKFALSFALVAVVFVGLAAANKLPLRKHQLEDEELDTEFEQVGGHQQGHLGGSQGILRQQRRGALGGAGLRRRGGVIGGGAGGAIGGAGFRNEGELDANVHSGTRIGSHNSAAGSKGFLAGGKKQFNAGVNRHNLNENEGHNRHQVVNKNKLIVAESDNGFSTDTGFRNRNENSDSAHLGASSGKFVGGKAGGKVVSDHELEHEHGAGLHAEQEQEGAIGGAIGGVGAGAGADF